MLFYVNTITFEYHTYVLHYYDYFLDIDKNLITCDEVASYPCNIIIDYIHKNIIFNINYYEYKFPINHPIKSILLNEDVWKFSTHAENYVIYDGEFTVNTDFPMDISRIPLKIKYFRKLMNMQYFL